jgi:YVTN family beta-propeller protein
MTAMGDGSSRAVGRGARLAGAALALAAVTTALLAPARAAAVSFSGPTNFAAGSGPDSVAVGDFDGDSKPDLVVANALSGNVSVLLGDGTGGFSGPANFVAGGGLHSVAVGDFDGDSRPDLAVANYGSRTVSILLGDGAGGFSPPTAFAASSGPASVAVGEFNGDSKPDLAAVDGLVAILLGDGSGGFSDPGTEFDGGNGPESVAVGDFNGDFKSDLAVANVDFGGVSILLGDGSGGFTSPTHFVAGSRSTSVAVGEFNGDSKPDLAVANYGSSNVSILLGDGSGGFTSPTNFAAGNSPDSVAVGDFDGDSKPDVAAANYLSANVSILLGDGSGGFSAPANFAAGSIPFSVAVGDFNGDSKPDLAVANLEGGNVSILLGQAEPTLATTASPDVAFGGQIHDTATLAGGSNPTGTITFKLYGPGDASCSRSPAFTDTKTVSGNANYDSADFEPTEAGVYRWTASYGGDSNNAPASSACNAANESVTVSQTPDHTAYVANFSSNSVTPIDTATNTAETPIAVGTNPFGIAITPDGATAYVTNNGSSSVTPIDTATNTAETPIAVGSDPVAIAITPDGATAYVTNFNSNSVTPIDTATNSAGTAIAVGNQPDGIAITPDGATAYVVNHFSNSVTPIDTATNTAGAAITVGSLPFGIAITPDGATAYVPNQGSNSVTPIDTATNTAGTAITVGSVPDGIAITPDGATAYVLNGGASANITPIDTATNAAGTPIAVGSGPRGIAITPDQAPTASFVATPAPAGSQTSFDASGSSASPGQTVASYHWDFGDGSTQTTSSATTTHTYTTAGNQTATLTVTDDAGCSTDQTFTGQTISCNGSGAAQISHQVTVAAASPGLSTNASADVSLGGSVHDTATLTGGAAPSGQITFKLYGPGDATCSGSPAFTDTKTVSGNASYDSSNFTPTAAGTYRWTASYSGDANNDGATSDCNASDESTTVAKASPTISTTPVTGVTVGANIHDEATVSGRIEAQTGATVEFKLYGPGAPNCEGAALFTDSVSYPPSAGAVSSPNHAATEVGTYHWSATYSGDANNDTASSTCSEASVIAKATPTLVTAASPGIVLGAGSLSDTATLAGGQSTPTGTVTFKLYGPNDPTCSASAISTSTKPVSGNGDYGSDPFTPTAAGNYRWTGEYSGDANNDAIAATCNAPGESTAVAKATPTLSTTASADMVLGAGRLTDSATLNGRSNPLAGATLTFKLYGPNDPTCAGSPVFESADVSYPVGGGPVSSDPFTPTAAGDYRWVASYSGDASNEGAGTACGDPGAAVTVAKAETTTALAASSDPTLRAGPLSLRLTATLSGADPTGQVTFLEGSSPIGSADLQGGRAILTPADLPAGSHEITARYGGDANNRESTSAPLTLVIEEPAPKVTLTYSPNHPHSPNPKGGPRYAFRFADEAPGVTFYCRLDKASFKPCHSPKVYRHLKRGRHVFKIKSVDAAGRESAVQKVKFFAGRRR